LAIFRVRKEAIMMMLTKIKIMTSSGTDAYNLNLQGNG
jgi:hypothetical protein